MASKKERKERLYASIGELGIAKRVHAKKQDKAKKEYSKVFTECLARMRRLSYSSIHTCPIFIWYQLMESGKPDLLLKEPREIVFAHIPTRAEELELEKELKLEVNCLNFIYAEMRNELIKEFGWGESKMKEIELIQEIIDRHQKLQADGDATQYTWIKIAEEKLQEIWADNKEQNGKGTLIETAVALESTLKISIKINECPVAMFYGYIKMAEKMNKKQVV